MSITAVYPGTFDPITLGHTDLCLRAAKIFPKMIFAVADSPSKRPLFSLEERLALAKQAFHDAGNIEVMSFKGLIVDFAKEQQARVIVRGVRSVTDMEYEFQMMAMNRIMADEIETVFLAPGANYAAISASLVREIAQYHGDLSSFVSPAVARALANKYKKAQES